MNLKDLITNESDKLSHTKVWANIAYAAATYKFMFSVVTPDIWLIFLGIVGAHGVASKAISVAYKGGNNAVTE